MRVDGLNWQIMNVVVDIGNTRSKYAFFEHGALVGAGYDMQGIFEEIGQWKEAGQSIELFLSGSGRLEEGVKILLKELSDSCIEAAPQMPLPIRIGYATPETLGFDRIAVCAGAMSLFPGKRLLVIDSGTAITYNYVEKDGIFSGGNISPGLEIRFRALHQFTAQLPCVEPGGEYRGIGQTTESAIRNGVMNGMLFEVKGYIETFYQAGTDGRVVITGGNSRFLENRLGKEVLFNEHLGFMGLNFILEYNKRARL